MSDEDFEKGLQVLLNKAYNRPRPSEEFRSDLLMKLKDKQRRHASARRHRTIALFSTIGAAAAVFAFAVIPTYLSDSGSNNTNVGNSSSRIARIDQISDSAISRVPANLSAYPVSLRTIPASTEVEVIDNQPEQFAPLASVTQISGHQAKTFNNIEIRNSSKSKWLSLSSGDSFTLKNGMEIRTPMGAIEPVTFGIDNGPMVMLDGMSEVKIQPHGLDMLDGRMVVSLKKTDKAVNLDLSGQKFALQPGAMVFARMDNSEDYANGGSPVPMMVLLQGDAATLDGSNNRLASGRVYELYDTGTGKYPSRQLGSYENIRRFMPLVNAIQVKNEIK